MIVIFDKWTWVCTVILIIQCISTLKVTVYCYVIVGD